MSARHDHLRRVLLRFAWARLCVATAAAVGGVLAVAMRGPRFLSDTETVGLFAMLTLPPSWLIVWSLQSVLSLVRAQEVLSGVDAWVRWGRIAMADAAGLIPMAAFFPVALVMLLPMEGTRLIGPILTGATLILACSIHLVSLPNALHRVLAEQGGGGAPSDAVPPQDPIRAAFRRLATYRLACLVAACLSVCLPWFHAGRLSRFFPLAASEFQHAEADRAILGLEILIGRAGGRMALGCWFCGVSLLLLIAVSVWEIRRGRWPLAPRWSQTRVFLAWGSIVVAAAFPVFVSGGVVIGLNNIAGPLLAGGWANIAAMATCVVVFLAFTPLRLMLALRARAESDRLDLLAERQEEAKAGEDVTGVDSGGAAM